MLQNGMLWSADFSCNKHICQAAMMWNEHAEKEKIKLQFLKR